MSYDDKLPKWFHGERTRRIDLGLAILQARTKPGECHTYEMIAAFCGCSKTLIQIIEGRAIRKLTNRLRFIDKALGENLSTELQTK